MLTLTCTATVVEGLVEPPILEWLAPDGSTITITGNPAAEAAVVTGQVSTSVLRFLPVLTSQAGQYSCRVSINIPGIPPTSNVDTTNVTVQSESLHAGLPA